MKRLRLALGLWFLTFPGLVAAQPAGPLPVLDVPFISQSEALCGGAAAAMILRYWGARGLTAESFAPLVDRSAAGIRTEALIGDLRRRGWSATGARGTGALMATELGAGRPVLALVQDRPGTFHYIVVVASGERGVIFHDPARAPFRVLPRADFERRWDEAGRWMAVVTPGPATASDVAGTAPLEPRAPIAPGSCNALIAAGVERAQANDLEAAEAMLVQALSCPGSAAPRELAGVRLLQRRWPEVAALAEAAVTTDRNDAHAWRLLATSRFLEHAPLAALDAWNAVGEPRVDLVRADGLLHTRHRVVERLVGISPGEILSGGALVRAGRRLAELPAALTTRVDYVPLPGALAEVRAAVVERPRLPRGRWAYTAMALTALARRELGSATGSLFGGGESVAVGWRFWPRRPRLAVGLNAPAPWGGVWGVEAFGERQPFTSPSLVSSERLAARVSLANWVHPGLRVGMRVGVERRRIAPMRAATIGGSIRFVSSQQRVEAETDIDGWIGGSSFGTTAGTLRLRSSAAQKGLVLTAQAGAGRASRSTPADLWFAGDTGHVRSVPLRAHPVLERGALRTAQLGRDLVHASVEVQRWTTAPFGSRVAVAAFVDATRATRRLDAGVRADVDAGIGIRLAAPLLPGLFRIDVARGLHNPATAVSIVYVP